MCQFRLCLDVLGLLGIALGSLAFQLPQSARELVGVNAGAEELLQRAWGGSARVDSGGTLRGDGLDSGGRLGPGAKARAGQHDGGADEAGDAIVLVLAFPALAGDLPNGLQVDADIADEVLQILLLVGGAEVVAPAGEPMPTLLPHAAMAGRIAVFLAVVCRAVEVREAGALPPRG